MRLLSHCSRGHCQRGGSPAREKYAGFNHSHRHRHRTQVLADREGIQLGRQTASRPLNRLGLVSSRRYRPPRRRVRRERMPRGHAAADRRQPPPPAAGAGAQVGIAAGSDGRDHPSLRHPPGQPRRPPRWPQVQCQPRHVPQPVGPTQFTPATRGSGIECETPRAAQGALAPTPEPAQVVWLGGGLEVCGPGPLPGRRIWVPACCWQG